MADTPEYLKKHADSIGTVAMKVGQGNAGVGVTATVDPGVTDAYQEANTPSAVDTALSMWRRETIIGNLMSDYKIGVKDGDITKMDDGFNPYSFYAKNRDEWKDIEQYVRTGGFDHIYNEDQFKALAEQVRRENRDLKNIEGGSAGGLALGMGLSLADLATFIPFAAPAKGMSAAYNAGRVGMSAMAAQGAQEMYLHHSQQTRTGAESAINVGLAGVIGGGIGIWGSARHPAIREKLDRAVDETADHPLVAVAPGMEPAQAEHVGSVGAARVNSTDTQLAGDGSRLGNLVRAATPVGRAFQWTAGTARDVMQGMLDLGGSLTKGMSEGRTAGFAAEDLQREYMTGFNRSMTALNDDHAELNMELGAANSKVWQNMQSDLSAATGGLYKGLPVDRQLYGQIVSRKLTNETWQKTGAFKGVNGDTDLDAQWLRQTLKEYGFTDDAFDAVDKWTSKTAKEIQKGQQELEDLMVQKGLIPEEKRLGSSYGMAQLWNSEGIIENTDGARSFFLSIFSKKPSEEFLADNFGTTLEEFNKLPLTDPKRGQIMTEWVGESEQVALQQAQNQVEMLTKKAAETEKAALLEAEVLGILKTEHKKASLKAARAKARDAEAGLMVRRLERFQEVANDAAARLDEINAKIEHHTGIAEGAESARGPMGDLLDNLGPTVQDAGINNKGYRAQLGMTGKQAKAAEKAGDTKEVERLMRVRESVKAELEASKAELAEAKAQFLAAAKEMRLAQRWVDAAVKSVDELKTKVSLAEGKAAIDKMTDTLTNRYAKVRGMLEEALQAKSEMWQARRAMQSSASAANRLADKTGRQLTRAERGMKKLQGKTPMADYVDTLVERLTSHEKVPLSQLKEHLGDSGRMKDRMIHLSTEERRAAEADGFLHHDLPYVLERQYRDLSGRMALMDKFGEMDLKTTIRSVKDEYESLIRKAKDEKTKTKLRDEMKNAVADVEGVRDRILGRNMAQDDPESLITWGVGKLRQMTFLRFVGGFVFGSLSDLASHHLHGSLGVKSFGFAKEAYRLLHASGLDPSSKELKSMLEALEMTMAHSTSGKLYGVDDLFNKQGVGTGLTRKITGKVDQVTNFLASRANTYAGMTAWNGMGKAVAGLTQMANLAKELPQWSKLPSSRKAQLASLGIGEAEAKQLSKLMEKHGQWHGNLFDPNAFNWHREPGGMEAHRMLRMVTRKLMDRAVLTPGVGDVPLIMDSTLGKLTFQFQSYGFAMVNRFLTPASQRLFQHGDMKVVAAFATLFGMATLSETIKAYIRGEDISKWDSQKWTKSVIDRSGIMAYMSPYVDTGMKLAGLGGSAKYQANSAWESMLGPWAGTLKTSTQVVGAAAQGDLEKAAKKAHLLIPFNQYSRIASHMYDDVAD